MKIKKKYKSINTYRVKQILKTIFENMNFTREDIIRKTGINSFQVYSIVANLLKRKIIVESQKGISSDIRIGRRSKFLSINPNMGYVIGVSIGHNDILETGLFDFALNTLESKSITIENMDFYEIVEKLIRQIKSMIKSIDKRKVYGIGIARPGITVVDRTITDGNEPYVFDWENPEVIEKLKTLLDDVFHLPIYIEPKNNVAVFGEYWNLKQKGYNNIVYLDIGNGVGAGIMIDGKIVIGGKDIRGDIGHMIISSDTGRLCVCGNRGCLGALVCIPSIISQIKESMEQGVITTLNSTELNFDQIIKKFDEKDKIVINVLSNVSRYIATGIINIVNLFSPEIVIIGGRIKDLGNQFEYMIKQDVDKLSWVGNKKGIPEIKFSQMNDNLIKGAGLLVLNNIFSDKSFLLSETDKTISKIMDNEKEIVKT